MPVRSLLLGLVLVLCAPNAVKAQRASVTGFVRDSVTGETLLGANVAVAGAARGAATNTSGFYALPDLPASAYVITFSFLGYRTRREELTLAPAEERRLDVLLAPEALAGEEIVVEADLPIEEEAEIGRQDVPIRLVQSLPSVFESDLFR